MPYILSSENNVRANPCFAHCLNDMSKDIRLCEQWKRPFLVISDTRQNIKSKTPVGFIGSSSPKKSKNIYTLSINLNNRKEHSHINFSQFTTLGEDRFIKKIDDKLFDDLAKEALKKFMNKIIKIDCSEL